MPAIHQARLKLQVARLMEHVEDAPGFSRALIDLLDYYADRTYRLARVGGEPPLLPAFFVPKPVLREVIKELREFAESNREATLRLADALWEQPYYECHYLSARLLGLVQPDPPEAILERVASWAQPPTEASIIETLVVDGLGRVRAESPERYFAAIKSWLKAAQFDLRRLGLRCLPPLVEAPAFEDLPSVFKLLTPLLREAIPELRPDLLKVFQSLVRRSPRETGYYLRQMLVFETQDTNTRWLIRRCLQSLPEDLRADIRARTRES